MRAVQVFDGDGTFAGVKREQPICLHAHVFAGDEGTISVHGRSYTYQFKREDPTTHEWPNDQLYIWTRKDGKRIEVGMFYAGGIGGGTDREARVFTERRAAILKNGGAKSYLAFKNLRRGELALLIQEHCTKV